MIFAVMQNQPTILTAFTVADMHDMLGGRTLFVDPRATGGRFFNHVMFSCHKTKGDILADFARIGLVLPPGPHATHEPEPGEETCEGCAGLFPPFLIMDRKCLHCWREMARKLQAGSN